ncbi:acyltransferase [Bradyrhizobium sp. 21]|uniref:acyltransferase family protein n=1 Tax=Bradyrhizobium sp. 21 TaxID=2782666 RepID=UPI001FFBD47F|nr:acyltransferase [Bradyrhizobium sp. 21]MCK1384104.1 acyltransferase [Bradyrhizobium sp. 21]
MSGVTIAARIDEVNGRSSGFDYLRILLAFGVVVYHTLLTTYGLDAEDEFVSGVFHPLIALILPCFFALSGFLVAGSLERSRNLAEFLALRVLRIFPALSAEILLSALLVGPAVTSLAWKDYFSDPLFFRYFFNIVGHVQFKLPGAFDSNPFPQIVNGQLWTVPFELECYIALSVMTLIGAVRYRYVLLLLVAGLNLAFVAKNIISPPIVGVHGVLTGRQLVMTFFYGVMIYRFKDKLVWSSWAFAICALASVALLWRQSTACDYLALPFIAYVTAYLGLTDPKRLLIVKIGDLSYGVFLYSFTIQQLVVHLGAKQWWTNLLATIPLCLLFALFSWTCVEKPFLGFRKHLVKLDPLVDFCTTTFGRFIDLVTKKRTSLPPGGERLADG